MGSSHGFVSGGRMVALAVGFAADAAARSNGGLVALPVTLTLPMIILLVTEHYALKAARATGGAGGVGSTVA